MSDTPRTDASKAEKGGMTFVWVEFAQQLERELNAITSIADRACNLLNLKGGYHESYELRNEIKKLKQEQ